MRKLILLTSFVIFISLLISCTKPPDVVGCVEVSPEKGWCTYSISDKEFYVTNELKHNGKTWWEMRPTFVLLPPESWAEIKTYIIKMCKKHEECEKDIAKWERKASSIDTKLEVKE